MNRELILFIAYKACGGTDNLIGKNPFQYRNALRLIAVNLFLHIIQLVILLSKKDLLPNGQLSGVHYISFVVGLLVVLFLVDIIFPKKVLAKAIKQYKVHTPM